AQLDELYVAVLGPGAHRSGTVRGRPGSGRAAQEREPAMTALIDVVSDLLQSVGVVADDGGQAAHRSIDDHGRDPGEHVAQAVWREPGRGDDQSVHLRS